MFAALLGVSVVYRLAQPHQGLHLEHHRTFIRPAIIGPSAGFLGAGMLPFLAGKINFNPGVPAL